MREGSWRLGRLRELCKSKGEQIDFDFMTEHPVIRDMDTDQSIATYQQDPFE